MSVTLKKIKMCKSGDNRFITVPRKYLRNGDLNADLEYDVTFAVHAPTENEKKEDEK